MVIVLSVQDEGLEEHLFAVLYAVVGFAVYCGRMSSKSTAYHLRSFWFVYTVVGESWLACSHHCASIQQVVAKGAALALGRPCVLKAPDAPWAPKAPKGQFWPFFSPTRAH